jgi:hypothetical protein
MVTLHSKVTGSQSAVPVQFSSSVKMYSAKDVSAKVNSTHHGTIYTVG